MSLLSILNELQDFDTALLANTIGYIDPTPAHEIYMAGSIQSVTPTLGPTVGVAATCELDTSTPGGEPVLDPYYQQLDEIQSMEEPVVWVVKAVGSRPDHECIMGDGMAKSLFANGCLGAVTDGGLRDVEGMLTIPFAAYCHHKTIHHCAMRFRSINQPVDIGGITIRPGDVIHANAGGVIKIPSTCLEILPAKATQMRAFEHDAHRVSRRTDLPSREKPNLIRAMLAKHGFSK
jgi:4-hydroxy-4-methyl-2-oxoglutarate aldolase